MRNNGKTSTSNDAKRRLNTLTKTELIRRVESLERSNYQLWERVQDLLFKIDTHKRIKEHDDEWKKEKDEWIDRLQRSRDKVDKDIDDTYENLQTWIQSQRYWREKARESMEEIYSLKQIIINYEGRYLSSGVKITDNGLSVDLPEWIGN